MTPLSFKIATTGVVLLVLALMLRNVSDNDAPDWWQILVVGTGAVGMLLLTVGTLLMIWSA